MLLKRFITPFSLSTILLCSTPTLLSAAPRDVSHSTNAELRLEYLNKLLDSRSGQRLAQHKDGKTKGKVHDMLDQARAAIDAGNEDKAAKITKRALKTFMTAVRELPEDPEEVERAKKRYKELRRGLEKFTFAQENNKERFATDENSAKEYNQKQVTKLLGLADKDAAAGKYDKAVVRLTEAQSIVTSSLQGMLNNKQLVIELDLSTPEKEYYYELRRYQGYEDLIAVAIDVKKPSEMASETMLKLGDKAKWMSDQARTKAMQGDYPVAIRMIMDATNVVKQALRLAGVTM